ncbi:AAA family ATPase [uncultured Sneathiella sp.]|uniref:AAA family ATPase n=1 Tax=uncultured Sneathiella sp. TaxID=879315 RepID=UPI0030EBEABE|tara:strand:+ start:2533 stop:3774 length:1242 start_codon:yes stop_codon:yes gene_type:complete
MAKSSSLSTLFGNAVCEDFMAFIEDEKSLGVSREVCDALDFSSDATQDGGITAALNRIEPGHSPKVVLADITKSIDPESDITRLVRKMGHENTLIILGSSNDVGEFRKMIALGAKDYLVKPLTVEILKDAVENVDRQSQALQAAQSGKLTVLVGVRGGVGATTIATNLAWIMANEEKLPTALLDMDLHFGTTTLSLDIETGGGFREALENPHRLDKLFLDSAIVKDGDRLAVLGTEEPIDELVDITEESIDALIGEISQDYNQVIVDLPRHLLPTQGALLASADTVILVSDQSLAGIRDINRITQAMTTLQTKGRILKVVSRVGSDRAAQVSKADFERGLNEAVDYVIPEDAKSLTICANAGKAISEVAGKTAIAKVLRELSAAVSGYEKPQKKGLFTLVPGGKKKKEVGHKT